MLRVDLNQGTSNAKPQGIALSGGATAFELGDNIVLAFDLDST